MYREKRKIETKQFNSMKNLTKIIVFALLLLSSLFVNAGVQPPITGILRTVSTDTIHVGDTVDISQSHPSAGIADYDVRNIISLNFDNSNIHFFSTPTTVKVAVSIYRKDSTGAAM